MSGVNYYYQSNKYVSIAIKELSNDDRIILCKRNSSMRSNMENQMLPIPDFGLESSNISDFKYRIFTSGCYYIDPNTGLWLPDGLEVLESTNLVRTYCISRHLTDFAGGLIVVPKKLILMKFFRILLLIKIQQYT